MAGSPGTLKNALEDWLEQNFPSGYTSCIKIQGRPILPPVMTEERKIEMRRLREIAVEVENRLKLRKGNIQEDTAGGEAMYEGAAGELYFANSLPTSLAAFQEEPTHPLTNEEISQTLEDALELIQTSRPGTAHSKDMLKEFDPLAEGNRTHSPIDLLNFNTESISEKNANSAEKTVSKPSSVESSIALSYSTDLNHYMDITEGSVDVSMFCSDQKSVSGTGVTTPSTVRPDSASSKSQSSMPWKDRKATFEDLNNYLDSLLSNSSDSKKQKPIKDNNQNVVNSSTSPQSSQRTISPPSLSEGLKPFTARPPPLTSPQGSLQTRIMNDSNHLATPTRGNKGQIENVSDFLQSCNLSPVGQHDVENSYQQKVQLYLQNLVIDEGVVKELTQIASSQLENPPQSLGKNFTEACSSDNLLNEDALPRNAESNSNGYVSAPPRLVRSNSYTLDSPSPMLLAHMEAELRKNVCNEPNMSDNADASQDMGPSRRVWNVESHKNMPSWCNRPSNVPNTTSKTLSPKKVLNRTVSAQPNAPKNLECRGLPPDSPQKQSKEKVSAKFSTDHSKTRKSSLGSLQKEAMVKAIASTQEASPPNSDDSKDKARTLLLHLQLQHNQEMEALLNRQRKEKEAIRLALLEEQRSALRASEEVLDPRLSRNSTNSYISAQSQSPPTKDKALQLERINTSPSIYKKDNSNMLLSGQVEYNKSSSISLDSVTSANDPSIDLGGGSSLIDLGPDEIALNNNEVIPHKEVYANSQRTNLMVDTALGDKLPSLLGNYNGSSEMISSFPPNDLPTGQMDRMTSSLPPEILSLHFSNTELTFQKANSVSCTTQSSVISISKPISVAPNIFSSAYAPSMTGGSPRTKRRSWCSRQLFPDEYAQNHPDWVTQTYELQKHQAATKIQAGVRGYLTRRLLKTERVQNCITTIRDTIVCALQLQRECAPHVEPSDLQLHGRLIQQLSAACEDLHHIFMGLPLKRRMAIIAADRERLRIRTPRSRSSLGSRPLSRATQIALQRKFNQTDPSDSASIHSRSSSTNRSRRRSWAVESRMKTSAMPTNMANNCEVVSGCLSRSSAPMSLPLQRSASAGSSRKPWR